MNDHSLLQSWQELKIFILHVAANLQHVTGINEENVVVV